MRKRLLEFGRRTEAWTSFRRHQLHEDYDTRREHYHAIARREGLAYDEDRVAGSVAERLAARGYAVTRKAVGSIHTFAFIPRIGWHDALYPDLRELGPVSEFDYAAEGYSADEFYRGTSRDAERRAEMNARFVERVIEIHRLTPIDWIFVYASGLEILASTIAKLREAAGVPVVNMCLDDKQSWSGPVFGGQRIGQIDIAREFDLSWTSARVACEWYLVEGAVPVYVPEGFDQSTYGPMDVARDIDVSFIGGAYGFRPALIEFLRRRGVNVRVFGGGWNTTSVWGTEQVEVINRSVINLGMGGIGYSQDLTNVKTRDFEIPGTGGGLYLTTFNPDLAQHFDIPEEIVCYRNRDEMLELIRYYLHHRDEAREVARRARERSLKEHRWLHRYLRVCEILGILMPERGSTARNGDGEND